jgi:ABC-2 type transport system ATP-binding protein
MISIQNLNIQKVKKIVVSNLNLHVLPSEVVIIVGPNGSGKTTILNCLAGLIEPASGNVNIMIGDVTLVSDQFYFHPELSMKYHLRLIKNLRQTESSELERMIEDFGLKPFVHTKYKQLSLGNKRKIAILGGLLSHSPLLLLDEPLIGLDFESVVFLKNEIIQLKNMGTAFIISSNQIDELYEVGDKFLITNTKGETQYIQSIDGIDALKQRYLDHTHV